MAPEIKSGKEYNYKTDVYSLGIILYCILHGELPGGKT
jgi:serine/threonine protein kinase